MAQGIGNFIDRIQIGTDDAHQIAIGSSAYAVCTTAANTAAKEVNIPGFALNTGTTIHIKFNNANSASNPTLNVSGTGAKAIMQYGTTNAGTAEETSGWRAGAIVTLTYDGTNWIRDQGYNTNTTYTNGTGLNLTNGAFSVKYGSTAGTAVEGNDSRLSDSRPPTSHTHGNITNDGKLQTTDVAIANGDKLVITDSSDSNKIARTSLSFDGATDDKALTQKGTWETFLRLSGGTMTGALKFSGNNSRAITWEDGTWYQRILTTDDSTTDTAVFTFQQTSNSGGAWTDLFTIKDNGTVIANTFSGSGASLTSLNASNISSGTLNLARLGNQNKNLVLAGPATGNAAAPTFRALVAADVPNLSWNKITSDKPTTLGGYGITDAKIASGVITLGANTITPITSIADLTGSTITAANLRTNLGLTAALRFIGKATTDISESTTTAPTVTGVTNYIPEVGDVVLDKNSDAEYVCIAKTTTNNTTTYTWELLGRSGSWATSSHTHGNITNGGLLGTANMAVVTDGSKKITTADLSVTDANASTSATTTFVQAVTQNAQGKITVTKASLNTSGTWSGNAATATKATQDEDGNIIKSTYLKLSGGTMIGNIAFTATTYSNTTIDSTGLTWSGGTDAAAIFYRQTANNAGSLVLRVADDGEEYINFLHSKGGAIYLKPNTREFYPSVTNNGSIGTSTYKWNAMYATTFYGSLEGNADTATEFASNATVTLTGDTTGTSTGSKKSWSVATTTSALTIKGGRISTPTTAHAAADYSKLYLLISSGTMGDNRPKFSAANGTPAVADGYILDFHWDNSGDYRQQLALLNTTTPGLSIRGKNNSTWSDWYPVITTANIGTGNTNGTIKLGGTEVAVKGLKSAAYTESSAYAAASHGNHVPTTQTANNITFLRNDNSWFQLTKNEVNTLINLLDTGSSDLTANDYVITQYVGGGTTTTTYHRRPASKVVNATLVKAALGTVTTTAKKFLKDTGSWVQVDWGDLTGKPSTFSPSAHDHNRLNGIGRLNSSADAIAFNTTISVGNRMSWCIYDSASRAKDATNSPSFDASVINMPWDWGAYITQIAVANAGTRIQIRGANHTDHGEGANPRYTPVYGAWREVVTAPKATQMGSATKPIYISNTGQVTEGTALKDLAYISKGSGSTKFLREDGTWQTALTSHQSLSAYAPLASPALTGTPTAPTAANGTNTTQIATTAFVNNTLSYVNAMRFKGTLGTGGTITALPASHEAGDTYRVITAGTWAGQYCEEGTLIICVKDGTAASNDDWTSVETNEDGAVIGPASSTDGNFVLFSGATGRIIKNSSYSPSSFAASSHKHPVSDLTWGGGVNLVTSATANNQEWSIDLTPGSYTGTYWHVWSGVTNKTGTILACYPDDKHITMPGNIASTSTSTGTLQVTGGIGATGQVTALRLAANGSNTSYSLYVNGSSYLNGAVISKDYTHYNSNGVVDATLVMGTRGAKPTATTTNGTTTYSGATIGTTILTLGNNKIGSNSASGVDDNAQGVLRLYSSDSSYGEMTAYGSWAYPNTGLAIRENALGVMFRPGSSSYYTHISYQTSGNEALVAATTNAVTSFIFVNGEAQGNIASDRWTKLDGSGASGKGNAPGLQIKQNCVSIGKLIPNGVTPAYKLEVNGTSYLNGNTTVNGNLIPGANNTKTLGSTSTRWSKLYIGNADNHGDAYTPIYWNDGAPAVAYPLQHFTWTIKSGQKQIAIKHEAFTSQTYVISLVVTNGTSNLKAPLQWGTYNETSDQYGCLVIGTENPVAGDVTGYAIVGYCYDITIENNMLIPNANTSPIGGPIPIPSSANSDSPSP